jgi:hypothetical protein
MRLPGRLAAFVLVLALPSLAQQSSSSGSAAKPAPPEPNPALTEAFKDMAGTWACTGTMDNPLSPGTQVKTQGEMKLASELDGFAYTGRYTMEKNAALPTPMKASFSCSHTFVRITSYGLIGTFARAPVTNGMDAEHVRAEEEGR